MTADTAEQPVGAAPSGAPAPTQAAGRAPAAETKRLYAASPRCRHWRNRGVAETRYLQRMKQIERGYSRPEAAQQAWAGGWNA